MATYKVIAGTFHVKGFSPDGDSIRFQAKDQSHWDFFPCHKMIEWQWSLPALSVRDEAARNLAEVLDFSSSDLSAPDYGVPPVIPVPCALQ